MPKELRARLIRPAALEAFNRRSEKQNWRISTYRAGAIEVDQVTDAWCYQDVIDALQKMSKEYHLLEEIYDEDTLTPA